MGWSSGTYTKWNGAGGWAADATTGIGIEAGRHDTQDTDFQNGINNCLTKDGQNSPTANLPMGGYKHTGVANAVNATDYMAYGQIRNGTPLYMDTANNRVGINTSSPSNDLTVVGQVSDTDGTSLNQGQLVIRDTDNAVSGLVLGYRYQVGVTEYARIQAILGNALILQGGGGNVGIGLNNPAYQLQLSTDSAAKPTTNTWTIASDARIKTNIQDYTKGLAEICAVRPITYDYNGKGGIPAGPGGVSVIAQEVQGVFPECVGVYKGRLNSTDSEETDIYNYNGHAITFALINAVKELNDKITALQTQLSALQP